MIAIGDAYWGSNPNGGFHMTCTAPEAMHALCYASLNWLFEHWLASGRALS